MPYTVEWTETSEHSRELTDEEMAAIKGKTVEELAEMDKDEIFEGLDDQLAQLEDNGWEGTERVVDQLITH
ncbi:hypothetical protein [Streptomyces sp. NPDC056796]|uniref:hypothetical protein n=1 Tax=Streptomyces sp. NPDC056796 TaxID=3345947 RepID=UPI003682638D